MGRMRHPILARLGAFKMAKWIDRIAMGGVLLIAAIFIFGPRLSAYAHYGLVALVAILITIASLSDTVIERFLQNNFQPPPWEVPRRVNEFDDAKYFKPLLDRLSLLKTSSDNRTEIYKDSETEQLWKLIHWDVGFGQKRELFPLAGNSVPELS